MARIATGRNGETTSIYLSSKIKKAAAKRAFEKNQSLSDYINAMLARSLRAAK